MVTCPIDRGAIAAARSSELEIRRVTDAAGFEIHRRTMTDGPPAPIPRSRKRRRATTS